jgi:hypothetical protein
MPLHQLDTVTISPLVSPSTYTTPLSVDRTGSLPLCHLLVNLWTLFNTSTCSTSRTCVPQTDRCCHHALYSQEPDHWRDLFMTSHFHPTYHIQSKTSLIHCPSRTLYIAHIWAGYSHPYGYWHNACKFPLPYAIKFHLLNDRSITTVYL